MAKNAEYAAIVWLFRVWSNASRYVPERGREQARHPGPIIRREAIEQAGEQDQEHEHRHDIERDRDRA